jgi:predicted solute-binding protein
MSAPLQIAVWSHPVNEPVIRALEEKWPGGVHRRTAAQARLMLDAGQVHVALLPSNDALAAQASLEVLPAVAISSWTNPWATLMVGEHLGAAAMGIMHQPEGRPAALLAAMVLKEHYRTVVALHERDRLPDGLSEHALVTVPLSKDGEAEMPAPLPDSGEGVALDLGQEWSEMAGYPFVWSLFTCRKDEASPELITSLRDVMQQLDEERVEKERSWSLDDISSDFFLNHMRLTLDDLALASLTEFCDHLYFCGVTEEILPVQFASLPRDTTTAAPTPEEESRDE